MAVCSRPRSVARSYSAVPVADPLAVIIDVLIESASHGRLMRVPRKRRLVRPMSRAAENGHHLADTSAHREAMSFVSAEVYTFTDAKISRIQTYQPTG